MASSLIDQVLATHPKREPEHLGSPRTPLVRNVSSNFGSPSTSLRSEQDDCVVYELGTRQFSAGFAGESRPRCIIPFTPAGDRRVGDYRADTSASDEGRHGKSSSEDYELYTNDVRDLDLGLVEDRLERVLRIVHQEHLLLDQKPRRALLAVQSMLPTPLLEIVLKLLFNHQAQPPSVMVMTSPLLACVGAGVRNAIVVDIGWEETTVTAIGEYKEVQQSRSVRAGHMVVSEVSKLLETNAKTAESTSETHIPFVFAEEVTQRMAWCRSRAQEATSDDKPILLFDPTQTSRPAIEVPFHDLSVPIETAFFPSSSTFDHDSHELPLPTLLHRTLLALPLDLKALCLPRIIITGGVSQIPGLKHRLLQELQHIVDTQGWDPVHSYGSALKHHERLLQQRASVVSREQQASPGEEIPLAPTKKPIQDSIPHAARMHDDKFDPTTLKSERESRERVQALKGTIRGIETLGSWAGASLVASLKVKSAWEIEREDFMKHGLRDEGVWR